MKLVEIQSDPIKWLQWCYGIGKPEFPAVTASLAAFISSSFSKSTFDLVCPAINKRWSQPINDRKARAHGIDITEYVPFCIQSTLNPWIRSTTEGIHAFGNSALLVRNLCSNQAEEDALLDECQWVHLAADNEFKEVVVLHIDEVGNPSKVTKVLNDKGRQQQILATAKQWRVSEANQNNMMFSAFTKPILN